MSNSHTPFDTPDMSTTTTSLEPYESDNRSLNDNTFTNEENYAFNDSSINRSFHSHRRRNRLRKSFNASLLHDEMFALNNENKQNVMSYEQFDKNYNSNNNTVNREENATSIDEMLQEIEQLEKVNNEKLKESICRESSMCLADGEMDLSASRNSTGNSSVRLGSVLRRRMARVHRQQKKEEEEQEFKNKQRVKELLPCSVPENTSSDNFTESKIKSNIDHNLQKDAHQETLLDATLTAEQNGILSPPWLSPSKLNTSTLNISNNNNNSKNDLNSNDNKNVELCFIRQQLELNTEYDAAPSLNSSISRNHKESNVLSHHSHSPFASHLAGSAILQNEPQKEDLRNNTNVYQSNVNEQCMREGSVNWANKYMNKKKKAASPEPFSSTSTSAAVSSSSSSAVKAHRDKSTGYIPEVMIFDFHSAASHEREPSCAQLSKVDDRVHKEKINDKREQGNTEDKYVEKTNDNYNKKKMESTQLQINESTNSDVNQTSSVNELVNVINTVNKYMKLQERTHTMDSNNNNSNNNNNNIKGKSKITDNVQEYGTLLNSNAVRSFNHAPSLNTQNSKIDNMKREEKKEESEMMTPMTSQVKTAKSNELRQITTEPVIYTEKNRNSTINGNVTNYNNNENDNSKAESEKNFSDVNVNNSFTLTPTPSFTVTDTTVHHRRHTPPEKSINSMNNNNNSDISSSYNSEGSDNCKPSDHNEHKKVLVSEKVYSKENLLVPRHSTHLTQNESSITNSINNRSDSESSKSSNSNNNNKKKGEKKASADDSKVVEYVQSKEEWTSYKDVREVQTSRLPLSARRRAQLQESSLKQTPPSQEQKQKQKKEQKVEANKTEESKEPRSGTEEIVNKKSSISESVIKAVAITEAPVEIPTLQSSTPSQSKSVNNKVSINNSSNSEQSTPPKSHLPARNVLHAKNLNQTTDIAQTSKSSTLSTDENKRKDEQVEKITKNVDHNVKLEPNKANVEPNGKVSSNKFENSHKEVDMQDKVKHVKIAEATDNNNISKTSNTSDNNVEPFVVEDTLSTSTRNTEKSKRNQPHISETIRVAASARFPTEMEPSPFKEQQDGKLRGSNISGYTRRYVANSPSLPRPFADLVAANSLPRDIEEIHPIRSTHTITSSDNNKKTNTPTPSSQYMEDVHPINNNSKTEINCEMNGSPTRKSVSPAPVLNQRLSTSREMPRRMSWSPELAQLKRSARVKQNTLVMEMTNNNNNNKTHHKNGVSSTTSPIINSLSTLHEQNANVQNSNDNNDKKEVVNSVRTDSLKKNADDEADKSKTDKNNVMKIKDNNDNNKKEKVEEEVVVVRLSELKSARPTPMTTRLTEKRREEAIRARREREQREAEAAASLSKKAPFDVSRHEKQQHQQQQQQNNKQAAETLTENNNSRNNDVKRSKEQLVPQHALHSNNNNNSTSNVKQHNKENTHFIPIHHTHNHYPTARLSTLSFASLFGTSTRDTMSICSDKLSTSDVPMSSRHPRPRQDKKMTKSTIRLKTSSSDNKNAENQINASATARIKATNTVLESSRENKKYRTNNIKPTSTNGTSSSNINNNNSNEAATARVPHTMTLSSLKEQDTSLIVDANSPISPLLTTRVSKHPEKQSQGANRKNVTNDKSERAQTLTHSKQTVKEMDNVKKNVTKSTEKEGLTVEGKMIDGQTRSQGKATTTENENTHTVANARVDATSGTVNNDDKTNLSTNRNDGSNKENLSVSNPNVIVNSTHRLKSASPEMPPSARGFGFPIDRAPSQPFQYRMAPFCIECGHRHVDDMAKFCAYCGHKRVPVESERSK